MNIRSGWIEPESRDCISEFYKLKQKLSLSKEEIANLTKNPNYIRKKWGINAIHCNE